MDISHGCFSGTADQFDNLRLLWAQAAGYGLADHREQGGPLMPNLDYSQFTHEDMCGVWPEGAPQDPLLILLVHYERGGLIKKEHCPYLADRLEEVETRMNRSSITTPAWILMTQQFILGLRTAAHYRQDVVFS
jgi:hypothetical protein